MKTLLSIFLDVLIFIASVFVYACATIYSLFFPPPPGEPRSDEMGHFLTPIYTVYSTTSSTSQKRED